MQNAIMNQNVAQVAMDTKKVVTASDIALACGVSKHTVHCILNNYNCGTRWSKETGERVRAYAEKVGYDPKAAHDYGVRKETEAKKASLASRLAKSTSGNFVSRQDETERMFYLRRKCAMTNQEIADKIGVSYQTVLDRIGPQPVELTKMSFALAGERIVRRNQARRNVLLNQKIKQFEQFQKETEAINARAAELEAQAQRIADEAKAAREQYSSKVVELDAYRREAEKAAMALGRNLA